MDPTANYYQSNDPLRQVIVFLGNRFEKGQQLETKDLAALDSFHLRGRAATVSLAESVDLHSGLKILDVGSGPGGTARYLAEHFKVSVLGIDLTYEFSRLAAFLSEKVGLDQSTRFTCASALTLPLAESSFDGVWMEHVQMNIPDKPRLVSEIERVLKPSGFLAMYEIFQNGDRPPDFPLPWADNPSCSRLTSPDTMKKNLESAGFHITRWHDCMDDIRLWLKQRAAKPASSGKPVSDVRLLMGDRATDKVKNLTTAVMDRRLTVIEAVCRKP